MSPNEITPIATSAATIKRKRRKKKLRTSLSYCFCGSRAVETDDESEFPTHDGFRDRLSFRSSSKRLKLSSKSSHLKMFFIKLTKGSSREVKEKLVRVAQEEGPIQIQDTPSSIITEIEPLNSPAQSSPSQNANPVQARTELCEPGPTRPAGQVGRAPVLSIILSSMVVLVLYGRTSAMAYMSFGFSVLFARPVVGRITRR